MKFRIRVETDLNGSTYTPEKRILCLFWIDYMWWGERDEESTGYFFYEKEKALSALEKYRKECCNRKMRANKQWILID